MEQKNEPAEYRSPPRRWPFPALGRNVFLIAGLLLLALILLPFWGAIAVAAVFAFGLTDPIEKVSKKLGNRRKLTSFLLVAVMTILLLFPAALLSMRAYEFIASSGGKEEASGALSGKTMQQMENFYKKVEGWAVKYGVSAKVFENGGDARESLRSFASNAISKGVSIFTNMMASLPELVVTLIVFGLCLYGFLAHPRSIKRFAFRLNLFKPDDLKRSINIFKSSSYESLVTNFIVGALQASIITLGAGILGITEYVLVFSIVFMVSFIPFIGAAPVGYALALIFLVDQGATPAIIMAVIATLTGVVDNIARSYLVANGGNEVSPILSFAAILGAIGVLGLKGIFLGPVILTATVAFLGASKNSVEKKPSGRVFKIRRNEKKAEPPITRASS